MKFDISKVVRLMKESKEMDLLEASKFINEQAPEWRGTAVAAGLVDGSCHPVAIAEEYNEYAGERAVEYAKGSKR